MLTLNAKLVSVASVLFHNQRLADPTDPYTRELKKLTANKRKTDADLEQIKRIEWRAGFYDENETIVVPSDVVLSTIQAGARKQKRGQDVAAGVFAEATSFPLEYEGPKTFEELYADKRFVDYRGVVVMGKRVMRARPIFKSWSLTISVQIIDDIINRDDVIRALEIAGERCGIGDYRPQHGRFRVSVV